MASLGRGYGGSNVTLVRNESSNDTFVAMLTSCSPVTLQVQRADGSLEDAVTSFDKKRPFCAAFEASGEDPAEEEIGDDFTQQVEKKRRLTFDQVRSLEYNFEIENKLEPERKMQLAKELGLQPRQVAVWFQNRRARWKTKQLERDYEVLNLDYNRLKKEFDAVIQEKQELQDAVKTLKEKSPMPQPSPAGNPQEKLKKPKTATQPSPPRTSEAPVKLERTSAAHKARNGDLTRPHVGAGLRVTFSSDSLSSEILNADSPHTTSDSVSLPSLDQITTDGLISGNSMVDSSIMDMSDSICDQILSPLACQRVSVKLEEGSCQDDSCNYILSHLYEEKCVPWWDWP
ncbi:uncharacterized protein [Physcomitrium patens]|uniref:Homeobox domain-containing protein n=1 Tax=Physcomitrium patens TaxID=3218 RepID=A0A2K1KE35_PHYPA|nr:homeobox-leucine zipper protein HOX25-like [Physcomitrium patens]PNR52045.1 hypothetical protein PHYPA_008419 [Physcomitrium patens]|eukprot:XP_024377129.1 homeobox-leucine zipper protein HOX25-like [Physcomitrella patens]